MHHGLADGVSLSIQETCMDEVIVERVKQENKPNGRVDVNNNNTEHGRHEQLVTVDSNRPDNSLKLGETILWYYKKGFDQKL